jgi:hypothetical protein
MRRAIFVTTAAILVIIAGCVSHSRRVEISQPGTATLTGRIVDCRSGEPLPGAIMLFEGAQIGAMADTSGYFVCRGIPPGSYPCASSCVLYEKRDLGILTFGREESTSVNIGLLPLDARHIRGRVGPYTITVSTSGTVGTDVDSMQADWSEQFVEDTVCTRWRANANASLLQEVATLHLRNLQFLLDGTIDSLRLSLSPSYIDLWSCRQDPFMRGDLETYAGSAAFSSLSGREVSSVLDTARSECLMLDRPPAEHDRFALIFWKCHSAYKAGDVIVLFPLSPDSPLMTAWTGVYRQIDGRWIMIAGAFPCCRY